MYNASTVPDTPIPPYPSDDSVEEGYFGSGDHEDPHHDPHHDLPPRRTRLSLSPSRADATPLLDGSYVKIDSHELLREYREAHGTPLQGEGPDRQRSADAPGSRAKDSIVAVRAMMAAAGGGGDASALLVRQTLHEQQQAAAAAAAAEAAAAAAAAQRAAVEREIATLQRQFQSHGTVLPLTRKPSLVRCFIHICMRILY